MQSKALNSNSGVAFSPPSIVKDTLGDSGMLLDTDITLTNSLDNSSSSQVHNIINKIENKLLMRDCDESQQQIMLNQFKPLTNNFHVTNNRIKIHQNQIITDPNHVQIINTLKSDKFFNKKIVKSFSAINQSFHENNNLNRFMQNEYNPYADENDSNSRFQLSKSTIANETNQSQYRNVRIFGNDRTNFVHCDRSVTTNKTNTNPNKVEQRRENYQSFDIINNMAYKNATHTNTSSKENSENVVMFKNYDLNDEYWLNFE